MERSGVAVVVSGGGARGAYEAGVLSVLLPALERQGQPASIFLGTSAGAINAVAFASMRHLSAQDAADAALSLWRDVRPSSVFRSPLRALLPAPSTTRPRPRGRRATALLDTAPLAATLASVIDWDRLHDNVDCGLVTVGVVATAWSNRRSVVFLERAQGMASPPTDVGRSIDYLASRLAPHHVLASAGIPVAFPAVEIDQPSSAADWYVDGGLRMNTPLKPAVALGAKKVMVVATDPAEPGLSRREPSADWAPSAPGGAAQLLYALLTDRMVEDLRTLARKNQDSTSAAEAGHDGIEWLFAGPAPGETGPLAALAGEVLQGQASGPRSEFVRILRRSVGGWIARDPGRLELLTHLMFDPEFIDGAIRLGQRDARRSLDGSGQVTWQMNDTRPTTSGTPVGTAG